MISSSVHLQFIVRPSHSEKKREAVKFPQVVCPGGQIPPGSVTWRTNSPRFSAGADKFPLDKFPVRDFVWGQFVRPGICLQKPFNFVEGILSGGNLSASPPVHHQFCTSQFFCCKTFWIEWYILLSWCTSDKMWICKNIVYWSFPNPWRLMALPWRRQTCACF